MAQIYGRKVPRPAPTVELDDFLKQFAKFEVYGLDSCRNADGGPIVSCRLAGSDKTIVESTIEKCRVSKPLIPGQKTFDEFKYEKKTYLPLSMINHAEIVEELKTAINPQMICVFNYDDTSLLDNM